MPEPYLEAQNLGHRFPDGIWAFRGIDFSLRSGEIAILAGRNGAGKTVFAKHLAGLIEPSEGSVKISGVNIGALPGNRAARVGYVYQDARLQCVGETVLDDALFGPVSVGIAQPEARRRAESALSACGLLGLADAFVHRLSGGELRRLSIAGALAMAPKAVILDEPFANLDYEGVRDVLVIARGAAASGTAILIVTHEIEKVLGLASSMAILDRGRLVLDGPPVEVLAAGIESYGLRDPMRTARSIADLQWLG